MQHPKNKHEAEVFEVLQQYDRIQLDAKMLKKFKTNLKKELAEVNAAHPESAPIGRDWRKNYEVDQHQDQVLELGLGSAYSFKLYASKN